MSLMGMTAALAMLAQALGTAPADPVAATAKDVATARQALEADPKLWRPLADALQKQADAFCDANRPTEGAAIWRELFPLVRRRMAEDGRVDDLLQFAKVKAHATECDVAAGNERLALGEADEAVGIMRQLTTAGLVPQTMAYALEARGYAHAMVGETDRAQLDFAEALPLYRQAAEKEPGYTVNVATILFKMGRVFAMRKQTADAVRSFNQSLALLHPVGTPAGQTSTNAVQVEYNRALLGDPAYDMQGFLRLIDAIKAVRPLTPKEQAFADDARKRSAAK